MCLTGFKHCWEQLNQISNKCRVVLGHFNAEFSHITPLNLLHKWCFHHSRLDLEPINSLFSFPLNTKSLLDYLVVFIHYLCLFSNGAISLWDWQSTKERIYLSVITWYNIPLYTVSWWYHITPTDCTTMSISLKRFNTRISSRAAPQHGDHLILSSVRFVFISFRCIHVCFHPAAWRSPPPHRTEQQVNPSAVLSPRWTAQQPSVYWGNSIKVLYSRTAASSSWGKHINATMI